MQSTPAGSGNAAGTYASDPHSFSSSSSSSSARLATPVLRTATPQQALLQAVHAGDTTVVKNLLATGGIYINAIDPVTWLTPLMLAATHGHEEVALALIRAKPGAEVNQRNDRGDSALSLAAAGDKTDMVELLLNCKADIQVSELNVLRALLAVASRHIKTADSLLLLWARASGIGGSGVPLVVTGSEGWRAFNSAASSGPQGLAQRLQGEETLHRTGASASVQHTTPATLTTTTTMTTNTTTTTTTNTTTTVTTSVVTTMPSYIPMAWGAPGAASLPAAPSWAPTASHLEVQRLAEQVVDGKLKLEVGIMQDQSKGPLQALAALLRSPQCKIKQLAVINSRIGAAGAALLSEALKVNRTVAGLDLSYNDIGTAGAGSLSEALKVNRTLLELDLYRNDIGDAGAVSLSEALRANGVLTKLSLAGNEIGAAGLAWLSEALKFNRTLTRLDLGLNMIDAAGGASLSDLLKLNGTLIELDLGCAKISTVTALSLSEALKVNRTLTGLDLSSNQIGDTGTALLSDALKVNGTLTKLSLDSNQIGAPGAASLSQVLKVNRRLITLDLGSNRSAIRALNRCRRR